MTLIFLLFVINHCIGLGFIIADQQQPASRQTISIPEKPRDYFLIYLLAPSAWLLILANDFLRRLDAGALSLGAANTANSQEGRESGLADSSLTEQR